ncbi:diaminopimelate dehydrogenase [Oceanobacillus alkalisoli]|uniref:diaminopimelate dehydrogenase n=1 Tax=Oceanobacillus alkalisoli TaxID=2925113 RepID=UPI001EE3B2A0|nr:diaminopimelate dehydrogenase [Oceanobacillus alkalisoli]MCG5104871.1 diaminopimelate dehydrogenase [Oceanobacillus alkalisoli]
MDNPIRIGILGYGNLGRGTVKAVKQSSDMEIVAVFTRRNPADLKLEDSSIPALHIDEVIDYKDKIDVMILCGGSATDLPEQGPAYSKLFTTVDSFDTHAKIPEYFEAVDAAAKEGGNTSIIAVGWDPGLFSINRLVSESIIPNGETYTFWGKGLSQGHSDAVRRVEGVKAGVQYTIPSDDAMDRVRSGENPTLETAEKHRRICYIVPEDGYDQTKIEHTIKTMPNYFADFDTEVHFITEEQLAKEHAKAPHGGFVIRSGQTGEDNNQLIEFSLKLDSNPEFTSSVLVAYARAAHRLNREGATGAKTVFDIAPGLLSPRPASDLRRDLL